MRDFIEISIDKISRENGKLKVDMRLNSNCNGITLEDKNK